MPLCNSHYKPMCTAYTDNHYGFCSSSRLQACSCRLSLYEKLLIYVNTIQDPHTPGGRIILVHSLVPGGSAMRDGRLKVGDKLLSVNQVSLVDQSLQFAAQCLLAIQPGRIAIIVVCHSLSKPPGTRDSTIDQKLGGFVREKDMEEEEVLSVPPRWTMVRRRSKWEKWKSMVSNLKIINNGIICTMTSSKIKGTTCSIY